MQPNNEELVKCARLLAKGQLCEVQLSKFLVRVAQEAKDIDDVLIFYRQARTGKLAK